MTDTSESPIPGEGPPTPEAEGASDPETRVRQALRQVVDPEIQLDVVSLGLIREVRFGPDGTDITMILTTPFCPYGGWLIQQAVDAARSVVTGEVRVTMGDEVWSPAMMEGADLAEWGLM